MPACNSQWLSKIADAFYLKEAFGHFYSGNMGAEKIVDQYAIARENGMQIKIELTNGLQARPSDDQSLVREGDNGRKVCEIVISTTKRHYRETKDLVKR